MLTKIKSTISQNKYQAIKTLFYLVAILLVYAKPSLTIIILKISCFGISFIIKVIRIVGSKKFRYLVSSQLTFYLCYFLVGLELVFLYKGVIGLVPKYLITLSMVIIIEKAMINSLFMSSEITSVFELLIYSICQLIHAIMTVIGNIELVNTFDFEIDN